MMTAFHFTCFWGLRGRAESPTFAVQIYNE
jgi:hypothetical protein